jgi:hypothetical protein
VHCFQRVRIQELKGNARHAEHIYLSQEFPEIHTAFVVYEGRAYKADIESGLSYAGAHVDVFRKHFPESAHLAVDFA